ncbi:hypothetical protein KGM_209593 [Danaus plexippus plexippus]|uniref:Uncharacterized protein n=1 Tax=Danaus plexippus plexippus TaxID=278856 RepID=A0A212FFK3_DANPL|nr:hypothetical protein KGM_209593 [Danaus plexippus plexippus]
MEACEVGSSGVARHLCPVPSPAYVPLAPGDETLSAISALKSVIPPDDVHLYVETFGYFRPLSQALRSDAASPRDPATLFIMRFEELRTNITIATV